MQRKYTHSKKNLKFNSIQAEGEYPKLRYEKVIDAIKVE